MKVSQSSKLQLNCRLLKDDITFSPNPEDVIDQQTECWKAESSMSTWFCRWSGPVTRALHGTKGRVNPGHGCAPAWLRAEIEGGQQGLPGLRAGCGPRGHRGRETGKVAGEGRAGTPTWPPPMIGEHRQLITDFPAAWGFHSALGSMERPSDRDRHSTMFFSVLEAEVIGIRDACL